MTYREIVHTCSHDEVARAAVDSIGGEIALRVAAEASRRNLSRGAFAAHLVKRFAASADELDLKNVSAVTHNSDVPVLSGLRYILERQIANETPPAWMIDARACESDPNIPGGNALVVDVGFRDIRT